VPDTLTRLAWQLATVVRLIEETPTVKSLVLDVPGWKGHFAGQHLDVRLTAEDGYQAERSYSIASAPAESQLKITVERLDDGEVSPYLVGELRTADELELRGPIGGWFTWRPADGGPVLLIAGGTGIVPLMSMIRQRAAVKSPVPVSLLYSSRSVDELIYRDELERHAAMDAHFEAVYTLTRSQPVGWEGYRRRLDTTMLEELRFTPADRPLVYICGPTAFVETAATACVEIGHAPDRIKTERFGPTGGTA